jgi:ankyrin repeat protein
MKMKFILTVIASLAASGLMAAATNDLTTLLQRGLFEEEANHQLDAAIGDYKEAIEHFDHERQLAATAIFRLGECYRKLGRTNEANAQYERIVREFPDQTQFAQLSRTYLPAGAGAVAALAPGASALPPDEEKFLREVTESVQNSPDLVNEQLFTAAKLGYVSAADFLIAHGADVNMQYRSQLPLIEAATTGNEAMAKLLLKHGAAVNGRDHDGAGQTALICAVQHGFLTVCQTLVAQGADVNLQSPIVQAARKGNEAILHLLLSHGAAVDSPDSNGQTALSSAVADGFMTLCPALLAAGADVNTKDKNDWTPLHVAVEHGNLPAAKFLITNKAHLDAKTDEGQTPLFIAIKRSDTNMAKLLSTATPTPTWKPLAARFGGSVPWRGPFTWIVQMW